MRYITIVLFLLSSNIYAASLYDTNMDRKSYYDADRTQQDQYEKMAKELNLFINNTAPQEFIDLYKNGELKLTKEELELESQKEDIKNSLDTNTISNNVETTSKEDGFFSNLLGSIGLGTKKEEVVVKDELNIEEETNIVENTTEVTEDE